MSTTADLTHDPRRLIALGVLLVAAAMDLIGATVVTLALPAIHDDLGAGEAALEWIIASYGLAFAVGLEAARIGREVSATDGGERGVRAEPAGRAGERASRVRRRVCGAAVRCR